MRKLLGIMVAGALALTATSATAAPVNGDITLSVSIEGLAPVTVTQAGAVDVTGTTISIANNAVVLGTTLTIPVTGATAIQSIQAKGIGNQSATFSMSGISNQLSDELCTGAGPGVACNSGGSNIGGAMGINGIVIVQVIPGVLEIPVALDPSVAGIGVGKETNSPFTFDNAGFTTGSAFVRTNNAAAGNQQVTVSGGVTANGRLSLVTPTFLSAVGNVLPVTTTLTVPIPEPGTLLLLGSGVAGLALVGRRRRR